ncbi:MAG TPA: F0F1 ATP synthase subunit epsilon [Streptosporangiaceae bacterium]|jgi:F-type H+-transporting ATPase subunit epsilon
MALSVELVNPEGEIWSGQAELVIARTLDGEIGILTGHAPVIGILAEGSTVTIRASQPADPDVFAAVSGGFLSVADDRVSILAKQALLGQQVNVTATKAALDQALAAAGPAAGGPDEPADVRYYRALLEAAEESG